MDDVAAVTSDSEADPAVQSTSLEAVEMQRAKSSVESDQTNGEPNPTNDTAGSSMDRDDQESNRKNTKEPATRRAFYILLRSPMYWGRILTLIIALILFTLSTAYCVAQALEVNLQVLTLCESPKTSEEIWSHSYQSGIGNDGKFNMTTESMYGWHDESCWTTSDVTWDTDKLWHQNNYVADWKDPFIVDYKFILYLLMALLLILSAIYNALCLFIDYRDFRRGELHTKWHEFHKLQSEENAKDDNIGEWNDLNELYYRLYEVYWSAIGYDTTGYILSSILSGFFEITLQLNAMLYYNGYSLFDSNTVHLAMKPEYILVFSWILCLNSIASGVSWLCYGCLPSKCHGLTFILTIFIIDQFSDFFYTIYPLIVVASDDYNSNTGDIKVLLGQLGAETDSFIAFISMYFPLLLLALQLAMYTEYARWELHELYFKEWKEEQRDRPCIRNLTITNSNKKGDLTNAKVVKEYHNCIGDDSRSGWIKRILLKLVSLVYLSIGILIVTLTNKYLMNAESECESVVESQWTFDGSTTSISREQSDLLASNPELFVFDHCLYKVYPFTFDDSMHCQCRVFELNWNDLTSSSTDRASLNLTTNSILEGALTKWSMLEKFKIEGWTAGDTTFQFTDDMFGAEWMKAFEWKGINVGPLPDAISNWKQIEYLSFEDVEGLNHLPSEFGELTSLKSLMFKNSGIAALNESICNLNQLELFQIYLEPKIITIPHCVGTLDKLNVLLIDECSFLKEIPTSIFNLPEIKLLSIFRSDITYYDTFKYNLPDSMDINDSERTDEWMNSNFEYQENATFWFSFSSICDEIGSSSTFDSLLEIGCTYPVELSGFYTACMPYKLGDGQCDSSCNGHWGLANDGGDCIQSCLANESPTGCNVTMLENWWWRLMDLITGSDAFCSNVPAPCGCESACDSELCMTYGGDDFTAPRLWTNWLNSSSYATYAADAFSCPYDDGDNEYSECPLNTSLNVYIDTNVDRSYYYNCPSAWIGDGICDDTCRSEECGWDSGDCDEGQGCVEGEMCREIYRFWRFLGDGYRWNTTYFCEDKWPIFQRVVGEQTQYLYQCEVYMFVFDYNADGYMNWRELVALGYNAMYSARWYFGVPSSSFQSPQINCSECFGENYNV